MPTREAQLARTFVELADTLVADFDVVDLLTLVADRCVEVFQVDAAGVMVATPNGDLRLMASSSDAVRTLELFELQSREGPSLDCFHSGKPVINEDLDQTDSRWPHFAPVAISHGFRSVHALPMRLRGHVIGALNLFQAAGGFVHDDVTSAQALADVATIAILHHRASIEAELLNEQLNQALNSRIIIEQAKGVLAGSEAVTLEEAFTSLRGHARRTRRRLADVATEVVDGTLASTELSDPSSRTEPG